MTMNIAVLAPGPVPPVFGGAERFFAGLVDAINRLTGHRATLVSLPSPERTFAEVVSSYEFWFGFDASDYDLVVSSKYPTWMVDHPRHHIYMLHPLRGLYDTYRPRPTPPQLAAPDAATRTVQRTLSAVASRGEAAALFDALRELLATRDEDHPVLEFPGPLIRDIVRVLDHVGITPPAMQRYASLSAAVARRPGYLPSWVRVHVAHPPAFLAGLHDGPFTNLFTVSRLDGPKRVDLVIEAMRHVEADVRLRIAGTGPERERLESLARGDERIEFVGFLDDDALVGEYANACAVPFVPADEDFGLIALEASLSSKPVITTLDAGGAREVVAHRRTGLVVPPTAEAIGAAMQELASDREFASSLGRAARTVAGRVTWERVLEAVLGDDVAAPAPARTAGARSPARPTAPRRSTARRLVVATTFPVHPRRGGGQLRAFHLYGALAPSFDVEVVSLDAPFAAGGGQWHRFSDAFREFVVAKTEAQAEAEREAASLAGMPVDDVFAHRHAALTPSYADALRESLDGATAVVLAHPFLAPVVREIDPAVPVVYDAHNAEVALKSLLLAHSPIAAEAIAEVRAAEGMAVRDAAVVAFCADNDRAILQSEYDVEFGGVFVPNGVDSASVSFVAPEARSRARSAWLERVYPGGHSWRAVALFVGSWHPPNIEAAEQIIAMAPELPEVLFLLVGSHCGAFERMPVPTNVRRVGVVGDRTLRSLLAIADVGVNPMLRGGGSNLKVLEYLAAGMPVVTTDVGARGQPEQASIVVAHVRDFPREIARVVADPQAFGPAVRAARLVVEREYDWSVLGRRLRDAISDQLPAMRFDQPPTMLLQPIA